SLGAAVKERTSLKQTKPGFFNQGNFKYIWLGVSVPTLRIRGIQGPYPRRIRRKPSSVDGMIVAVLKVEQVRGQIRILTGEVAVLRARLGHRFAHRRVGAVVV